MKRILFFAVLFLPSIIWGQLVATNQSFTLSGRTYDVTTPTNYDASKVYPIIFELHSFDKDRTQLKDQELVDELQYISVRPEATEITLLLNKRVWNSWDGVPSSVDDVQYIKSVYNDVKSKLGNKFDENQVYVYGFSNGGAMALKMLEETQLFKAATIRSMSFQKNHTIPAGASKVPIIFVHGTADTTVPYKGGAGTYPFIQFDPIDTTFNKWAKYYNGGSDTPPTVGIYYLKEEGSTNYDKDFYYKEYSKPGKQEAIYLFLVKEAKHATNKQFSNRNMRRALLKLAKNPACYGVMKTPTLCDI